MKNNKYIFSKFILNIIFGNIIIKILEKYILSHQITTRFISLIMLKNSGAAFSILSSFTNILIIFSLLFLGVFGYFYYKNCSKISPIENLGCTFLVTGIISNLIQRISLGYVIDYFQLGFVRFPVFNIADILISLGVAILILQILLKKEDKNE